MDFEKKWQDALLNLDATIQQAIQNLNDTGYQLVIIVSADGIIQGTITDGDIRRGLLKGLTLETPVQNIMNSRPFVAPVQMSPELIMNMMELNKIHQMPVVDSMGRVVGLYVWRIRQHSELRSNVMIIMAGGLGTRLRPHTETCPKPLLPVAGKPMLEHIIERARKEGIKNIILAVGYLGYMIEDYFQDGSLWDVQISYLREESPLGTAGALGLLESKPILPFIVTNGDVLTDIRYGELIDFHHRNRAIATMAVQMHEWKHPYGVVRAQGLDIIGFDEKPIYRSNINAGVYALDPIAFDFLNKGQHCDMPELFECLMNANMRTIVYPVHEYWLDVGRQEDFDEAVNLFTSTDSSLS